MGGLSLRARIGTLPGKRRSASASTAGPGARREQPIGNTTTSPAAAARRSHSRRSREGSGCPVPSRSKGLLIVFLRWMRLTRVLYGGDRLASEFWVGGPAGSRSLAHERRAGEVEGHGSPIPFQVIGPPDPGRVDPPGDQPTCGGTERRLADRAERLRRVVPGEAAESGQRPSARQQHEEGQALRRKADVRVERLAFAPLEGTVIGQPVLHRCFAPPRKAARGSRSA